jgi:hypothetical protein
MTMVRLPRCGPPFQEARSRKAVVFKGRSDMLSSCAGVETGGSPGRCEGGL